MEQYFSPPTFIVLLGGEKVKVCHLVAVAVVAGKESEGSLQGKCLLSG